MQANDEDRVRSAAPAGSTLFKEFLSVSRDRRVHERRYEHVGGAERGGAYTIPVRIMPKRLLPHLAVFEGLAERKVEMKSIGVAKLLLERLAHRGQVGISEPKRLEVGERPVSFAVSGPGFYGAAQRRDGIIEAT